MKSTLISFFISALVLFPATCLFSQKNQELRFHKIPDELLQGADLERFFVTKDGLLWFGTSQGLASFDGSQMVYYASKGMSEGANFRVNDLIEDAAANLWIATPEYGLLFFNRKTGVFKKINFATEEQLKSQRILIAKLFIGREGVLWIGTSNAGLFEYAPATKSCNHYNINPAKPKSWPHSYENFVRAIIQDKNDSNILWLGCYGNGICSFNKQTKQVSRRFESYYKDSTWESSTITNLQQINDSIIWYSTWGYGMNEYNLKTGFYRSYQRNTGYRIDVYPNGHILEYMSQKSDSEFYVAPRDTIPAIFNIRTKQFSFINDDELDKEYEHTQNVKTDGSDVVYFEKNGALFISSPRFNLFQKIKISEKINNVYPEMQCITWDAIHQKYFAGILLGEGVYVYDKEFHLEQKIPMPQYSGKGFAKTTNIWKLHRDKAGHLWALGFITSIYDSAKLRFTPLADKWPNLKLLDSSLYDVAEDKTGLLYFISSNDECLILNPFTLEVKKLNFQPGSSSPVFFERKILYDSVRNYIYLAHNQNLYQYNIERKTLRKLLLDTSYFFNREEFISSWMLDAEGVIWMSTPYHYLWKINPENFRIADTIKFKNTRIDLNESHLYGYNKEFLLISTSTSQLLFNTKNYGWIYLNRNNGLLANEGSKQMICNGNAFFSYRANGLTQHASFEHLMETGKKIIPYITFILVNNKPAALDTLPQFLKKIELDYTHNTISIGFSAIDQEFPDRLEYAYTLDEAEKNWIYINNSDRRINYANLSPGKYIFKVKVREWGLEWSPEKVLTIIITPPFWRRWWFVALCVILLTALLSWVIQTRIKTIRKQEQLKTGHEKQLLELEAKALRAQMNPHFIFNCMNSIKSLIQKKDDEKAIIYLTTFSKLIRTIFQNSDNRDVNLYDELETCQLYTQLESMRFGNKLNYVFNVDETLDLKSVMVPALIIQPFIENAIWHGIMPKENTGYLIVTVNKIDDAICCIIEDNGIGREMSKQIKFKSEQPSHQSKGVHLTQARIDLNNLLNKRNATIETIDKKDISGNSSGTKVILTFHDY
ncbi:MAG: histidine kinase [Ferruginibacter sp.]